MDARGLDQFIQAVLIVALVVVAQQIRDLAAQLIDGVPLADIVEGLRDPAPERLGDAHATALNPQEDRERRLPSRDGFGLTATGPEDAGNVVVSIAAIGVEFERVFELRDRFGGWPASAYESPSAT